MKTIKTVELKDLDLHSSIQHANNFNVKRYFEKKYNSETCSISLKEFFNLSVIEYFFKKFELIYHSTYTLYSDGLKFDMFSKEIFKYLEGKRKPSFYFKCGDYAVALNIVDGGQEIENDHLDDIYYSDTKNEKKSYKIIDDKNSKVGITIYYPTFKIKDKFNVTFGFLSEFIVEEKEKNYVSMLIKNTFGEYDFEPLNIKIPEINFELNYGSNFLDIKEKIINKLNNTNKGLYMFHGEPGTGKSSFIKYLTSAIKKEFIFVPTCFVEKFISDPDIFSILLKRKGCVLILEDAERVLLSRERGDNDYISTILNLSDGILSDMLEASVIITYNCDETKIDKALKRKGRTMVDYKFGKLSVEDCKKLAKELNFSSEQIKSIVSEMSLSEIYNISEDNKYYTEDKKTDVIIGFGKS